MQTSERTRDECRHWLAAEVLHQHGQIRITALGLSMLPTVWPGDLLIVQSASASDLRPGDIALYERKRRFVAHRAVGRVSRGGEVSLITRGDALFHNDAPVSCADVRGKVIGVERRGRFSKVCGLSAPARLVGLVLGSWGRLRSFALRIQVARATKRLGPLQRLHGSA